MPERFYTRTELAAHIRKDVRGYDKLSDDTVLTEAFKARPEMQSWLVPEPVQAPAVLPPSRFQQMKDITKRAISAVAESPAGQAAGLGVAAEARARQLGIPGAARAIPESVIQPARVAAQTVSRQIREAIAIPPYAGAGLVKGATMGYINPTQRLIESGLEVPELTRRRASAAGELLGAVAPISATSKLVSIPLRAAGVIGKAATVRPVLQGLAQAATTGATYGAAKKPEPEQTRAENALNDAAVFMAFTGTAQVFDKAVGWYIANHTAPGAYNAARQQIIDVFVQKGAAPEKAAEMADAGLSATIEQGGGLGKVTTEDLVAMRKAVARGKKVIIGRPGTPNVPATRPAAPTTEPPTPAVEPVPVVAATISKPTQPPTKVQPVAIPGSKLPRDLAGAKPRYAFGEKQFELNFGSDLDRAAYITAQTNRSKRDADYLKFAQDATGMDEQQVRQYGQTVRARIKEMARVSEPGMLNIPTLPPESVPWNSVVNKSQPPVGQLRAPVTPPPTQAVEPVPVVAATISKPTQPPTKVQPVAIPGSKLPRDLAGAKPRYAFREKQFKLPRHLAGAKPRYAFREKQFELNFGSDLDRAAYITAQATRSKRDADYLKFAQDATGMDEQQVRAYGQTVRARIKEMARAAEPGVLNIPASAPTTRPTAAAAGHLPAEPAPVAVPAVAPEPGIPPAAPAGRYLTGKLWDLPVEQAQQMAVAQGLKAPSFLRPEEVAADMQKYPGGEVYQKWAAQEDIYNKGSKTAVPMDIVEKYNLGDDFDTAMFAEAELKADRMKAYVDSRGGVHPLLDFVQKHGFINRDKLLKSLDIVGGKKWKGRELSEDLAWYVRPTGTMGPAEFAAAAFEKGLLPENDKHVFMEELARDVEIKQALKRGEDVLPIMQTRRDMTEYGSEPGYALKPPRDIAGQTFIPGSGPVMPTGKIRPAEGVDQEAFLEGFRPAPLPEPGLFEGPVTREKIRAEIARVKAEEESDALSARTWNINMPLEPQPGAQKIYKAQIRQFAEKAFNVPFLGRATIRMGDAVGRFFPKNRIIREKTWGELEVEAHEVAHAIDRTLFRKKFKENFSSAALRELQDLDYDQRHRRPYEGFAEWFRYYVTTAEAGKLAPAFTEEFKTKIAGTKMEKDVAQYKKMFGDWYGMGAEGRIAAQHDFHGETLPPASVGDKIGQANEVFYDAVVDKFDILNRAELAGGVPRTGPVLTPFELATKLSGKAAAVAEHWVMEGAVDFDGNKIGMSLKEALAPALQFTPRGFVDKELFKKFIYYASSKRGLERAAKGFETGFDVNDMKFYVKKYANPAWDLAIKQEMTWYKNLYDVFLGPVYTQAEREAILNADLFYVSAKRAGLEEAGGLRGGTMLRPGQPGYRYEGSGRPVINWAESAVTDAYRIANIGFKAKLGEALAQAAEDFPMAYGRMFKKVPAPQEAITFTAEKLKDYLKAQNISIGELDLDKIVTIFKVVTTGNKNIVPIILKGERNFYEVEPKLYKAMEALGISNLGLLVKVLKPFADLQKLGATGVNAAFGLLRNPLKDWPTFMVYNKYTNNPVKAVADLFVGTWRGGRPDELAKRWKAAGGEMANFFAKDREGAYRLYDTMLVASGGLKGKALLVAKHPINAMQRIFSIPESGPRLAEFYGVYEKLAKEQPYLPESVRFARALNASQDVSINFTRNGYLGREINQTSAYFNAGVQGPDKLAREAKRDPRVFIMRGLVYLTPLAVLAWYTNRDKDWYKNLPYAYRLNNLFFETKDAIYRIPQSFDIGLLFQAMPVAALDYLYRKDPAVVEGVVKSIIAQVPNPMPSALGPMIDVGLDKNYLGIPIEGKRLQNITWPPARTNSETMDFAIDISKGLNAVNIPLSPVQIQYMLNDYSGGMVKRTAALGAMATRPFSSLEPGELPVVGSVIVRNPENPQKQTEEFFAAIKRLQQKKEAGTATDNQIWLLGQMRKEYDKFLKPEFEEIKEARETKDKKRATEAYKRLREELEMLKKDFSEGP